MEACKHKKKQWARHIDKFVKSYAECLHTYDLAMRDYCAFHYPLEPLTRQEFYEYFKKHAESYFQRSWELKMTFNLAITEGLISTTRQGRTTFAQGIYTQLNLLGINSEESNAAKSILIKFDDPREELQLERSNHI